MDISYVNDELGRLIAVIEPPGGNVVRYVYDLTGNLLSITRESSSVMSIIDFFPKSAASGSPDFHLS
jgi:YD repeat-containing protein